MRTYLENSGTHNILIFGDLNNYFDRKDVFYNNPNQDNTFRPPNPANLRKLNFIMSNLELADVFRYKNPDNSIFSFKPFGNNNYMSRLDYCLASPIFKHNCNIEYLPIHGTLFDHAAVLCQIDTYKKITGIKKIKNNLLDLKGLTQLGKLIIIESYLLNSDRDDIIFEPSMLIFNGIQQKWNLLYNLIIYRNKNYFKTDRLVECIIDDMIESIDNQFVNNCPPDFVNNLRLTVDISPFLNSLLNNLNAEIGIFQSNILNAKNRRLNNLIRLRSTYNPVSEFNAFMRVNTEISKINDNIIKHRLMKYMKWECINREKPTRSLCSIFSNNDKKTETLNLKGR